MLNQPSESQPPPEERWYYTPGNKNRVGPFTLACLRQLFAAGDLRPDYKVWREGDAGSRQAEQVLGQPADHGPPLPGLTVEEVPFSEECEFIDPDPPDDEHEAWLAEDAGMRQRAFGLFADGRSLGDLGKAIQNDPVARQWLQGREAVFVDLVCGVYFPDLPRSHGRQEAGVEVRIRRAASQEVVWPTDATFRDSPAGRIRGLKCLHRYVCRVDAKSRRWLKRNAPCLFGLARLVVAREPEECLECGHPFKYPFQGREGDRVVVEGKPLDRCKGDEDHCEECCILDGLCERCGGCGRLEDRCRCVECRGCRGRFPAEKVCIRCDRCPRHCGCLPCRRCGSKPARCKAEGCGCYDPDRPGRFDR